VPATQTVELVGADAVVVVVVRGTGVVDVVVVGGGMGVVVLVVVLGGVLDEDELLGGADPPVELKDPTYAL
jgi:hypothetical protein